MEEYGFKYTCMCLQGTFIKEGVPYDRHIVEQLWSWTLGLGQLGFNAAISL